MDLAAYITGTYDLAALQGAAQDGEVLLAQSLVDESNNANIVTSLQKLTQRFLLRLLTHRGSMPYSPDEGVDFVMQLQQGQLRTTASVYAAFAAAESQIAAQFARGVRDGDQPDEQYRRANLVAVAVQPSAVSITVRIQSMADSATIVLPIPIIV